MMAWMHAAAIGRQRPRNLSTLALDLCNCVENFCAPLFRFVLNAGENTVTQSQHPAELASAGGMVAEILEQNRARKWVGCVKNSRTDGSYGLELENRSNSVLPVKSVSTAQRLAYCDAWSQHFFSQMASENSTKRTLASWTSNFASLCVPLWARVAASSVLLNDAASFMAGTGGVLKCAEEAAVKIWSRKCVNNVGHWQTTLPSCQATVG